MSEPRHESGPPGGVSEELRPFLDRDEIEGIDRVAERLRAERPLPRPSFRSELRAQLAQRAGARGGWRPQRLARLIAVYAGSGLVLLATAAVGLAGIGPLAY